MSPPSHGQSTKHCRRRQQPSSSWDFWDYCQAFDHRGIESQKNNLTAGRPTQHRSQQLYPREQLNSRRDFETSTEETVLRHHASLSDTPNHLNTPRADESQRKGQPQKHLSIRSFESVRPSTDRYAHIRPCSNLLNEESHYEVDLGSSSQQGVVRRPIDCPESRRRKMRTVSQDDYLLARGANPRTGVVTPACQNGSNPFDENELLRSRGVALPSKWRRKGDQWITLGLDQITPLATPAPGLKTSSDPRGRQRPSNLSPKTMSAKQVAEYQRNFERIQRAGGKRMDPHALPESLPGTLPETPGSGFVPNYPTPADRTSPSSKLPQEPSVSNIRRKAIGSPTKEHQKRTEGLSSKSPEKVITTNKPPGASAMRSSSAPGPIHKYYNADEVGKGLHRFPQTQTGYHGHVANTRADDSKHFLGLRKGDWIEDVPPNILDGSMLEERHQGQRTNNTQYRSPLSTAPMSANPTTMRPLMSNTYENRSLPLHKGVPSANAMRTIPNSKSWTPSRAVPNGARSMPAPYVIMQQSDPRHQGVFPMPQSGAVQDLRRRMETRSSHDANPDEQSAYQSNTSRTTIPTSIPTTTKTAGKVSSQEAMDQELFIPRMRPRGLSRPALPPRTDGTVSIPQFNASEGSVDALTEGRHLIQSQHGRDTVEEDTDVAPPRPPRPNITVTPASPERVTKPLASQNHCLHHQMGLQTPGPTICHCILAYPDRGQGLKAQSTDQNIDGSTRMLGKPGPTREGEHPMDFNAPGSGSSSLAPSPVIGANKDTADWVCLNHDRCCPTCCARGCHSSCLGHDSPSNSKTNDTKVSGHGQDRGRSSGVADFGLALKTALKNPLRLRQSLRLTRAQPMKVQQSETETPAKGEVGVTIAEVEVPLPWNYAGEGFSDVLMPAGMSGFTSLWSQSRKPSPQWQWAKDAPSSGKRILSDSSVISQMSIRSAFDVTNLSLNAVLEALAIPFCIVASYLNEHPQAYSLGKILFMKILEMLNYVLSTITLLWRWWYYYRNSDFVGKGKRGGPSPQDMVNLAREVCRATVYAFILIALAVMVGKVLGVFLDCLEWVFWIGKGVAWICSGFGMLG